MRSHVERRLNGDLQGVLDEAFLAQIVRQLRWPCETPEVGHARFDERELLGE